MFILMSFSFFIINKTKTNMGNACGGPRPIAEPEIDILMKGMVLHSDISKPTSLIEIMGRQRLMVDDSNYEITF
jgi:hypothetical protein